MLAKLRDEIPCDCSEKSGISNSLDWRKNNLRSVGVILHLATDDICCLETNRRQNFSVKGFDPLQKGSLVCWYFGVYETKQKKSCDAKRQPCYCFWGAGRGFRLL